MGLVNLIIKLFWEVLVPIIGALLLYGGFTLVLIGLWKFCGFCMDKGFGWLGMIVLVVGFIALGYLFTFISGTPAWYMP